MNSNVIPGLKLLKSGKVREMYDLGDQLLMVASDRISCFDVVLPTEIPEKGKILTALSAYWFKAMEDIIPHHLVTTDVTKFPAECRAHSGLLEGRSMLVKRTDPAPVECIVRGYLVGSGWKEYQETGKVCGIPLAAGLVEASRLDEPIFTPSTKAEVGEHDINIDFNKMVDMVGRKYAEQLRDSSLAIYVRARKMAEEKGIIIADTKFEFGVRDGRLILIDEVLTPDSSRFWPMEGYRPGSSPESFDKQYVRDYLVCSNWDPNNPPDLPPEVIRKTQNKYAEALRRLTAKN
ncbi:MAG TPA: phosphoribosylaminoimidazolesuccinocarboxamide synthase [Verrucomicrobiae bacterium]|jgi:phosphoribosylaminoimidazole-succinocarboxamide synthase|nr:phosphoribosylaminoimidazolesuccinocarboxamide synthase [Verrucomicrobiae bacterium]